MRRAVLRVGELDNYMDEVHVTRMIFVVIVLFWEITEFYAAL
jgi:hypothetical protein